MLVCGGPPASRPRRELRSARRLEARPGPAAAHQHCGQALRTLRRPPYQWHQVADRWLGAASRSPARPCHRLRNFARNSPATLSNIESRSLELQRFQTLLKLRSIELRAKLRGRGSSPQWCANWCIACLCGATCCRAETAITFARPECVFLWHCGRAKVSLVSCVPVNERAKAVAVSFGREKVRPAALCHRESAKKFALQAQNGRKTLFSGALGEFFAEMPVEGPCWANFF